MQRNTKHILVVDDNLALNGVIRFNLERAGFKVSVAPNGADAWAKLQQQRFDLVVTDYQMPELTGYELCQRMRQDDRNAEIPVVLLTAKELELDLPRLREDLGILEVFPKPFSPRELVQTITDHLTEGAATP